MPERALAHGRGNERCEKFRTDDGPRGELNPILRVLGSNELVPRTHCLIQTRDVIVRDVSKPAPVVVIPSHRAQVSRRVVFQRRVGSAV